MRSAGFVGALLALLSGLSLPGGALAAQERPLGDRAEPAWSIAAGGEGGFVFRVEVPEGWALYAPDPGELGLPLELAWVGADGSDGGEGGREVRARWPEPREEDAAYGPARVYRGEVRVELEPPEPRVPRPGALEVRWAICRDDLCVPGTTELPLPSVGR